MGKSTHRGTPARESGLVETGQVDGEEEHPGAATRNAAWVGRRAE